MAASTAAAGADSPVPFGEFVAHHARPLLRLSAAESVPVWLPWVESKIADDPRWIIASAKVGDVSAIADFDGLLGGLFEDYVFALLSRCYATSGQTTQLFGPIEYQTEQGLEESNDATLFSGSDAVFFEVTITHPRFPVLWNGDVPAFRAFLADRLVNGSTRKLWKLSKRIGDFRAGRLQIGGMDPASVGTIYPVLVTLLAWPRHGILSLVVDPVYAELEPFGGGEDLLGTVAKPVFVSAEELEMLEVSLRSGWTMPEVLETWRRSPHAESSLKNHLFLDRRFEEQPNPYLLEMFKDVVSALKSNAAELIHFD